MATILSAFHSPKHAQLLDDELNSSDSLAAPHGEVRVVKEILGQHHTARNESTPACRARTQTLKMHMQMRTKWMIMDDGTDEEDRAEENSDENAIAIDAPGADDEDKIMSFEYPDAHGVPYVIRLKFSVTVAGNVKDSTFNINRRRTPSFYTALVVLLRDRWMTVWYPHINLLLCVQKYFTRFKSASQAGTSHAYFWNYFTSN